MQDPLSIIPVLDYGSLNGRSGTFEPSDVTKSSDTGNRHDIVIRQMRSTIAMRYEDITMIPAPTRMKVCAGPSMRWYRWPARCSLC